jgi:hypothetical protein
MQTLKQKAATERGREGQGQEEENGIVSGSGGGGEPRGLTDKEELRRHGSALGRDGARARGGRPRFGPAISPKDALR